MQPLLAWNLLCRSDTGFQPGVVLLLPYLCWKYLTYLVWATVPNSVFLPQTTRTHECLSQACMTTGMSSLWICFVGGPITLVGEKTGGVASLGQESSGFVHVYGVAVWYLAVSRYYEITKSSDLAYL